MDTREVIRLAAEHLEGLIGHEFDVIDVAKPVSVEAATNLAKIVSKLSPIVGNLIEFNTVEYLNENSVFDGLGEWRRQDPGFPDTVFDGSVTPTPGFEIKAWFPLATEITARFKDSQNHFAEDNTYVAMLAWLPEFLIFGKPHIVDLVVVSGMSVAKARDEHYHKPPDYLVLEPEDTTSRTSNLQQTNTAGYKFQGDAKQLMEAMQVVKGWGAEGKAYQPTPEYQQMLRELIGRYSYRLDTNFAKMDRIVHPGIEQFKKRTCESKVHGKTVDQWRRLLSNGDPKIVGRALAERFDIAEDAEESVIE